MQSSPLVLHKCEGCPSKHEENNKENSLKTQLLPLVVTLDAVEFQDLQKTEALVRFDLAKSMGNLIFASCGQSILQQPMYAPADSSHIVASALEW